MSRKIWWHEFSAPEFQSIDPMKTIALLPVAAVEQHGPHLPVGTDAILNLGCIEEMIPRVPASMDLRILPVQTAGKSNEHLWQKGTVTHTAATLIEAWTEVGLSVARAGVKKLAIVNSHGGNEEVIGIVARELRVRVGMLVVKTSWTRFPPPPGLITDDERRLGIHGGDLETSLMLHFRPELADMSKAKNFRSSASDDEANYKYLRPTGTHAYAWIAKDLNPHGVVGDASIATAEKGAKIAEDEVSGMLELLGELERHPLPKD